MAKPEVHIGSRSGNDPSNEGDVEMQGGDDGDEVLEVPETGTAAGGAAEEEEKPTPRITFVE